MASINGPTPVLIVPPVDGDRYVAGACNIGTSEIRRRRAFAIVGFAVAAVMLVALVAAGAAPAARLVLFLPLWGGFFSWLQARRRFCAAYAIGGLSNFGDDHSTQEAITDTAAHREDLRAAIRIARDSSLLALVPTILLALLPL